MGLADAEPCSRHQSSETIQMAAGLKFSSNNNLELPRELWHCTMAQENRILSCADIQSLAICCPVVREDVLSACKARQMLEVARLMQEASSNRNRRAK